MVCISYFASCVTENDCSLLVFMSQKVSQTANVPVVTNTTHSINLTFDYIFSDYPSSFLPQLPLQGVLLQGVMLQSAPLVCMHNYAELHFNYILHIKVLRLHDCPSCPAAPPPPPPPPHPYTGRRGRYRPRWRRAGRGKRGRGWERGGRRGGGHETIVSLIIDKTL